MPAPAPKPRPIPFRKAGRYRAALRPLAKVLRAETIVIRGEVRVTPIRRPQSLNRAA